MVEVFSFIILAIIVLFVGALVLLGALAILIPVGVLIVAPFIGLAALLKGGLD